MPLPITMAWTAVMVMTMASGSSLRKMTPPTPQAMPESEVLRARRVSAWSFVAMASMRSR